MPFNGNGVFVRGFSWSNDAANSIPITASRMDSDTNDIVTNGLGLCLTRDGQGAPIANLPMNGFKHTGAAAGVNPSDYATMQQISGFAPLISPTFSGIPTAPTASAGTNTAQIATTSFVTSGFLSNQGGTVAGTITLGGNINMTGSINAGGQINAGGSMSTAGAFIANSNISSSNSNLALGTASPGAVLVRPQGIGTTLNQAIFDSSGNLTLSGPGILILAGNNQPTIFVQSGTPTARNVGDLWFF